MPRGETKGVCTKVHKLCTQLYMREREKEREKERKRRTNREGQKGRDRELEEDRKRKRDREKDKENDRKRKRETEKGGRCTLKPIENKKQRTKEQKQGQDVYLFTQHRVPCTCAHTLYTYVSCPVYKSLHQFVSRCHAVSLAETALCHCPKLGVSRRPWR